MELPSNVDEGYLRTPAEVASERRLRFLFCWMRLPSKVGEGYLRAQGEAAFEHRLRLPPNVDASSLRAQAEVVFLLL